MEIRLLRNAETQEAVRLIWEVFLNLKPPFIQHRV